MINTIGNTDSASTTSTTPSQDDQHDNDTIVNTGSASTTSTTPSQDDQHDMHVIKVKKKRKQKQYHDQYAKRYKTKTRIVQNQCQGRGSNKRQDKSLFNIHIIAHRQLITYCFLVVQR